MVWDGKRAIVVIFCPRAGERAARTLLYLFIDLCNMYMYVGRIRRARIGTHFLLYFHNTYFKKGWSGTPSGGGGARAMAGPRGGVDEAPGQQSGV